MIASTAPAQPLGLARIVRQSHPAEAIVAVVLLATACATIGLAPGLVTTLWLAVVTPALVVTDMRLRRLPNVLVVPGLVAVLADGLWAFFATGSAPVPAFGAASVITAVMLVLNVVGGLGMGDVKLSAVIAGCLSIVSPPLAVAAMMFAFCAGGAYSAVVLCRPRARRRTRIPFGPALLFAFWAAVVVRSISSTWVVSVS